MKVCMSEMHEVMPTVAIAHADLVGGAMDILEKWAQELKKCAIAMGYTVIDICGSDLTYQPMTEIIQATKPAILFYFGLGDKKSLIGNDMKPALNLDVVKGMTVIAYSSTQLGSDIIKSGSPCFVGFSDLVVVVDDLVLPNGTHDIFKDILLMISKRILQGWTVGAAVEATRNDLLNAVRQNKDHTFLTMPLYADSKSLKYLGDPNWKLGGV